jgi:Arc/MetJ family transcription regulator
MRLARRPLVAGFLLAVALGGVTGCRTDPTVAAYVGDARITESELDAAVHQRLEDPAIAQYAHGHEADYTRKVLGQLVDDEVYAKVAQRYGITVGDDAVRARIREAIGAQDPEAVYGQLAAQQGISRTDVFALIRQQLLRQQVAEREGLGPGLSDQALRSQYEQSKQKYARFQLGLITVPDQATADAVVAQLDADPGSYAQLAARFPGQYTLPSPQTSTSDQLIPDLQAAVAAARPNTAFALAVKEVPGVVVGFVGPIVYQSFDEVRGDLEKQATTQMNAAAAKLVDQVRGDLDVTVNPRYGVLKDGAITAGDGGVVDILGDRATGPGGAPAN